MLDINIRDNIRQLTAQLDRVARQQMPFATAQALNRIGKRVERAEQGNIRAKFKHPTPFTQKSIGVKRATKTNPEVTVFVKPVAAKYLEPYETGGVHKLPGRALLNPKDIKLNAYGQLPRATLAKLKARPDIFIGIVKTKAGPVNGVWQRVTDTTRVTLLGPNGRRVRGLNKGPGARLKLMLRFGDALPVNTRLEFGGTATKVISRNLRRDYEAVLAAALTTTR